MTRHDDSRQRDERASASTLSIIYAILLPLAIVAAFALTKILLRNDVNTAARDASHATVTAIMSQLGPKLDDIEAQTKDSGRRLGVVEAILPQLERRLTSLENRRGP